ncbi:hypothetical protein ACKWTF_007150 [Chironomus riparius]
MESVRVILIAILMIIVCLYNNADAKPTPMPQFPFTVTTKRNPVPWRDRNDGEFCALYDFWELKVMNLVNFDFVGI